MNRSEYMNELTNRLSGIDKELYDEIVGDYEAHFSEGIKAGKDEDEICRSLGSIDDLLTELGVTEVKPQAETAGQMIEASENIAVVENNPTTNPIRVESLTVADSNPVRVESMQGADSNPTRVESANGTEGEYKSFADGDDNTEQVEFDSENKGVVIDTVIVDGFCADITVERSCNGRLGFKYTNCGGKKHSMAYTFETRREGSTVYAEVKKVVTRSFFFMSLSSPSIELQIFVPDGMKVVEIKTLSGEMSCAGITSGRVAMKSLSGDINVNNVICDTLSVKSTSGDVEVGRITAQHLEMLSVSGDVNLEPNSIPDLSIESTSGDVSAVSLCPCNARLKSISGDVTLKLPGTRGYCAEVASTSGEITLSNGGDTFCNLRRGQYTFGNCESRILAKTISGDINIRA